MLISNNTCNYDFSNLLNNIRNQSPIVILLLVPIRAEFSIASTCILLFENVDFEIFVERDKFELFHVIFGLGVGNYTTKITFTLFHSTYDDLSDTHFKRNYITAKKFLLLPSYSTSGNARQSQEI